MFNMLFKVGIDRSQSQYFISIEVHVDRNTKAHTCTCTLFRFLYYADLGDHPHVGRCTLDGVTCQQLFPNVNIGRPNSIVLDQKSNRLFWADGLYQQIVSVEIPNGDGFMIHWQ